MQQGTNLSLIILLTVLILTGATACGKSGQMPEGAFKENGWIKIGEHTYYPEDLFEDDCDEEEKNYIIQTLEKADQDLTDDVFMYGMGQAMQKGEFRFYGKMINDGVIYDCADMNCWYDEETAGYAWTIDYSKFRRTDFDKNGLIPAEEVFEKVYESASKSDKVRKSADDITGTYLLFVDSEGTLYYSFTVNKYSVVCVDAKTGEILSERYWDGIIRL